MQFEYTWMRANYLTNKDGHVWKLKKLEKTFFL